MKKKFYFINSGAKSVMHLPKFLDKKNIYTAKIKVHESWLDADQQCSPGHDKLWGISLGHVHLHSSYRFTRKNFEDEDGKYIRIGYYAYIDGVSPQDNTAQKGLFNLDVRVNDWIEVTIRRSFEYQMVIKNLTTLDIRTIRLPRPEKFKWPITMAFPNDKCPTDNRTLFEMNLKV